MKRIPLSVVIAFISSINIFSQSISFSGYGEVFLNRINDTTTVDMPHVLMAADITLSDKWSFEGEIEYIESLDITQLWVQRSFSDMLNLKLGKITVPLGFSNTADNPMDHFTAYLPKCEELVLPYDWNQVGISLCGENDAWQYELLGLINGDKLAIASSVNNSSIENLRLGIGAYYGGTYDPEASDNLFFCGFDYEYKNAHFVSRGNIIYSDLEEALCGGIELGYDMLSHRVSDNNTSTQLFLFSRYDACRAVDYTRLTVGINYLPLSSINLKAEYNHNINPSLHGFAISLGIDFSIFD
ncbi:MAG: hypothetical protein Q4C30_06055 [Bacteroidia bacterium]|nr:hypothetical protein [Bacteroidia bacterium]